MNKLSKAIDDLESAINRVNAADSHFERKMSHLNFEQMAYEHAATLIGAAKELQRVEVVAGDEGR